MGGEILRCKYCDAVFESTRNTQTFCSPGCREQHNYEAWHDRPNRLQEDDYTGEHLGDAAA